MINTRHSVLYVGLPTKVHMINTRHSVLYVGLPTKVHMINTRHSVLYVGLPTKVHMINTRHSVLYVGLPTKVHMINTRHSVLYVGLPTKVHMINTRHSVLYVGLPTKAHMRNIRISEDSRANNFLSATAFFRDDIFTRTCDLQDINDVFGADLYCHKNCINSYILKHVIALKKVNSQEEFPTVSKKEVVFDNLVSEIDTDLRKGIG